MEEFFYLILIVVWLIISIYKRKNKQAPAPGQQQPQHRTQPPPQTGKDMEEMLEEFFGTGQQKKQALEEEVYEPEVEVPRMETEKEERERGYYYEELQKPDYEKGYEAFAGTEEVGEDYTFSAEGKAATIEELIKIHAQQDALKQAQDEEAYGKESESVIAEFDLKTAVVFSEILNRKYT